MEMSGYNNNNNNNGWSSGSESGWTGYLDDHDQSYYNQRNNNNNDYTLLSQSYTLMNCSREDQEDLSMVSDASSGPPHFQEDVAGRSYGDGGKYCYSTTVKLSKKSSEKRSKKSSEKKLSKQLSQHYSYSYSSNNHLDDTASSPALTYSKMFDDPTSCNQASVEHYMNFPQGISEGHFNEGSSYTNHYGFWQSSLPNDTHSAEQSHLSGRRWE